MSGYYCVKKIKGSNEDKCPSGGFSTPNDIHIDVFLPMVINGLIETEEHLAHTRNGTLLLRIRIEMERA